MAGRRHTSESVDAAIERLDGSQKGVEEASSEVLSFPPGSESVACEALARALDACVRRDVHDTRTTYVMYLINDVVQKDKLSGAFKAKLYTLLPGLLRNMVATAGKESKITSRVRKILRLWQTRDVYSREEMGALNAAAGIAEAEHGAKDAPGEESLVYRPIGEGGENGSDDYGSDDGEGTDADEDGGGDEADNEKAHRPPPKLRAVDLVKAQKLSVRCSEDLAKLNSALELCASLNPESAKHNSTSLAVEEKLLLGMRNKIAAATNCNMAYTSSHKSLQDIRERVVASGRLHTRRGGKACKRVRRTRSVRGAHRET